MYKFKSEHYNSINQLATLENIHNYGCPCTSTSSTTSSITCSICNSSDDDQYPYREHFQNCHSHHHGHEFISSSPSSTTSTSRSTLLLASSIPIFSDTNISKSRGGEGNGKIKEVLKKYRGPSISVEVSLHQKTLTSQPTSCTGSSMEMEILSQELRKAKASSIFTSDLHQISDLTNEQRTAVGNFPGPCPIVYNGDVNFWMDAVEKGATAVVMDTMTLMGNDNLNDIDDKNQHEVDIICRVENINQVQNLLDKGFHYAFIIPSSRVDIEALKEMLNVIPKQSVIIYSLKSMQKNNLEITLGKDVMSLSINNENGSKVSGLLLEDACVGDEDDIKYTSFAVTGLTKKASSTFAMTGLTGSTNGHFGTMSDNASIENTKWRRTMKDEK